jgi:hypothetical protein
LDVADVSAELEAREVCVVGTTLPQTQIVFNEM